MGKHSLRTGCGPVPQDFVCYVCELFSKRSKTSFLFNIQVSFFFNKRRTGLNVMFQSRRDAVSSSCLGKRLSDMGKHNFTCLSIPRVSPIYQLHATLVWKALKVTRFSCHALFEKILYYMLHIGLGGTAEA